MRIALFSWETSNSISVGGVAVHATELAGALERKGHEVHVFTRMGREDHSGYERIYGVHYHRCPFSTNPDFVEEINNMCRSFVNAFFATEDHIGPFDVIHAHDWMTYPA
ncbi:MAG: glycosyltransferase, partial [Candidatus Omnitrophica bacterium]|nr:glycosyltransferase [Candidatus Omnitrophota bacterium]